MWIARGLESFPPEVTASVTALGTFDGVHLGHRAILATAVTRARDLGIPAIACTFDPHPMEVLQPDRAPLPIMSLDERLALIAGTGTDGTVVVRFTREIARLEPEAFIKDVIVERLKAREVVVGYNHTFGRGARGTPALLVDVAARLGLQAHVVPPYTVDGEPVSSTGIRTALGAGDVERAARLLGRPYAVTGEVVRGAGRGRTLGFPTANVRPDVAPLVRAGVYACRVELSGQRHEAVVNVGVRPTFGEETLAIEAHLLDFTAELYGARIAVAFHRRIRDERRFPSVDALRAQIAADVAAARPRTPE
jgi:riboflavin kinase / FMN adenylyltransferase